MSKIIVTERMILGNVAKNAVQQSPYPYPENLEVVLGKLHDMLKDQFGDYIIEFEKEQGLHDYLHDHLTQIPEYWEWNERKNGNAAPMKFISRFDTDDNPDDDFIDLDALEGNVTRDIVHEASEL